MNRQSGVVLIVVMWMVMFLSVIGGSLLLVMVAERSAHAVELDQTQAEYLALAAVSELGTQAVEYFSLPPDQRAVELGEELSKQDILEKDIPMGQGVVRLSIHDETGKINLNNASERGLKALFAALNLPDPSGLAHAIVKWRADHRRFLTVGELSVVPEITPAILMVLSPYLTLYHSGVINPNTASKPALQSVSEELKIQFEQMKRQQDERNGGLKDNVAVIPSPPEPSVILQGRPWTAKKLQEELNVWASRFSVQSRMFQVEATGTIRRRSCTLVMVGDILQMTTGLPPMAEWRTYAMQSKAEL